MPDKSAGNERSAVLFACQDELVELIDTLTDVIFCAKDRQSRYIEVNAAFVRRTGRTSKRHVVGAHATDLFGAELAERYEEQDRLVFKSGVPLRDQLELIRRTNGKLGWYLTTKLPVFDEAGSVAGLVSVSRDLRAPSDENIALAELQNVVSLVGDRIGERLRVAELAQAANCTASQLESRMKRVFGLSATQYILRVRVDHAAAMLAETGDSLADISLQCGFYDQSDFTRRFARLTNCTPAEFRRLHS